MDDPATASTEGCGRSSSSTDGPDTEGATATEGSCSSKGPDTEGVDTEGRLKDSLKAAAGAIKKRVTDAADNLVEKGKVN